jgi:hypothetical protein
VIRAGIPGHEPDGALRHPLYREELEIGTRVLDAEGVLWRYAPRYPGDRRPWVCDEDAAISPS